LHPIALKGEKEREKGGKRSETSKTSSLEVLFFSPFLSNTVTVWQAELGRRRR